jgi:hypothetical protein
MGFKSDAFETKLLSYVLCNVTASLIGDANGLQGSAASGSLYVSLHTTTDPAYLEQANEYYSGQLSNELSYIGYARQPIVRAAASWTVTTGTASNGGFVNFPVCTDDLGSPQVARYFGVGTQLTGSGKLLMYGTLSPTASYSTGTALQFPPGSLVIKED